MSLNAQGKTLAIVKICLGGWMIQGPIADLPIEMLNHGAGAQLQFGGGGQFCGQVPVQLQFQ